MKHFSPLLSDIAFAQPLPTLSILGLPVVNTTTPQAIETLLSHGKKRVCFLNAHCANVRAKNRKYAKTLKTADFVLPDGIGVELAAKMTGDQITENLNGTDFVPALMKSAGQRGMSVYLLGAAPDHARRAAIALCEQAPGLRVAGVRNGYDEAANNDAVIADINASGADILLVAKGVPAQDIWLSQHEDRLNVSLMMGVGALFDFLAGAVTRAPAPIRKAKMEWVWRLAMEPRRMANRYLIGNAAFMMRAAKHRISMIKRDAVVRRSIDIAISAGSLLALSPLLLLCAALIKAESKGPVMFKQTRIGKNGVPFDLYKFRSMYTDAEERRAEMLANSDREGICFKARNDLRITRMGRFIRRFSIDELPQVINVLRGQMAIVGPRPALPEEVAAYSPRALKRLQIKPGITGVWQVSGRADIGFDKMIDMDIAYAKSRSPLLDFMLIMMTFRAVIGGRGAY